MISVQEHDFDHAKEYQLLREQSEGDGAIVTFTGLVRDFCANGVVTGMSLEHYPGMTEKSLMAICANARKKWELGEIRVIHRIGQLAPGEQIVFVGVTSQHRKNAFLACEYIIDYLKTQAPFWKQEITASGPKWVEAKATDQQALCKWQ